LTIQLSAESSTAASKVIGETYFALINKKNLKKFKNVNILHWQKTVLDHFLMATL